MNQYSPRKLDNPLRVGVADRQIEKLAYLESADAAPRREYHALPCPCCEQMVDRPTLEMLIDICGITGMEAKVFKAVWRGKGYAVPTESIFDAMYADDPNGGPSYTVMHQYFRIFLHRLRKKLEGSGVGIDNAGYGRGYRLNLKGK